MAFANIRHTLKLLIRHPLSKGRVTDTLLRYVRWQIGSRLVPGPVATAFVNNAMLLAKPSMTGATGNVYVGLHEFEDMAFVLHFLRPEDLFVDIGANIGSYTILAGACAGATCIAFEPGPETFTWLRRNIDINGLADKVEAHHEALGASNGQVSFTIDLDCCNHLVLNDQQKDGQILTVPMSTLDDAIKGLTPYMIKMDVEGFETEVMKGAKATLKHPELRCIIMELGGHGAKYGFDEKDIRQELRKLGFGEYTYSPFERLLVERNEGCKSANTIFIRDIDFAERRVKEAKKFSVVNTLV